MTTPKTGSKAMQTNDGAEPKAGPSVDTAIQGTLGRKLRDTYDQVVKEQVPDKFLNLLAELKQKEAGSKKVDG
jgi:hypothetical protein